MPYRTRLKVSDNTEKFISKRIKVLAEDLGFIEDSLKKIKSTNDNLIDYQYESQYRLGLSKDVKAKSSGSIYSSFDQSNDEGPYCK